ncbi:MAG: alpha/beta fold hydrolase [Burkholderiaceae bacterium]
MNSTVGTSSAKKPIQAQWVVGLRAAAIGQPTFVFFPHAGGSPLSAGRVAAALPDMAGILSVHLPRQASDSEGGPPRRAAFAADNISHTLLSLTPPLLPNATQPLILVGNSYGALLAFETARRLARTAIAPLRLLVSGFRSPSLPPADTPLYRLPTRQLNAELAARFGTAGGNSDDWAAAGLECALRADLEACDTYRYVPADFDVPIDVLHLHDDPSVSLEELRAWKHVTSAPTRLIPCRGGHFFWATHSTDLARILMQAALPTHAVAEAASTHNN